MDFIGSAGYWDGSFGSGGFSEKILTTGKNRDTILIQ
jgi:16S rRNA C1402 N4-methylase RsmH